MVDTAADGSKLNQEHGRASEFVLSSTTKPFAAAVDGNADSHQRSTTNSNATSKDAAAVASLPSGVALPITNVSGGLKRGQISLHFDPRGLASQGSLEDFDPVDAFDAAPSTLAIDPKAKARKGRTHAGAFYCMSGGCLYVIAALASSVLIGGLSWLLALRLNRWGDLLSE